MGREIKRVPAGFDWPMEKTWGGFLMPEHLHSIACPHCNQSGYNPETARIADSFYDTNSFGVTWTYDYNVDPQGNPAARPPWRVRGTTQRWSDNITQDEVQALIDKKRLMEFTHTWNGKWVKRLDGYVPTAQEVNEWSRQGSGHDGINRSILINTRANRLGVYGLCSYCEGEGSYYASKEIKEEAEAWEATPVPEGSWWQVWETVSEGSPVTPAFETKEKLANYLMKNGDKWDQNRGNGGWSKESVKSFLDSEWAPSLMMVNGQMLQGARDLNVLEE